MASQRRSASQGSRGSEFADLVGSPLNEPLTSTGEVGADDVEGAAGGGGDDSDGSGIKKKKKTNCLLRRKLSDSCARACWLTAVISLTLNAVAIGLVLYFFIVMNGNHTNPDLPPAAESNCSLAPGQELQAVQMNSTSMHVCWTPVNVTSTRMTAPYVLRLSDWFSDTPAYIAYSGANNSVAIYDLIPHVQYNISVERYTDVGVAPVVSNLTVALNTTADGGCSSMSDLQFLKTNRDTAKAMIQQCLLGSAVLPSLAVPCMVAHGMSYNCSVCWYEEGVCTIAECGLGPCGKDPTSSECKACSERACFPGCVQCSQVPRWVFPP